MKCARRDVFLLIEPVADYTPLAPRRPRPAPPADHLRDGLHALAWLREHA
jgi:hypothetical protein